MKHITHLTWCEVDWQRPYTSEAVAELLTHLAALTPRSPIIWEARGQKGRVHFYLGADRQYMPKIQKVFTTHGDVRFSELPENARLPVQKAGQLKISHPTVSLKTDTCEAAVRVGLAALLQIDGREQMVMQLVLGNSHSPAPAPREIQDPYAGWLDVALGNVAEATSESKSAVREKLNTHGFAAVIRLGSTATGPRADSHIRNLLSALRTLESAGVRVTMSGDKPDHLNTAHIPWSYPLKLTVKELTGILLLPIGEEAFPGVAPLHPKHIRPPEWYEKANKTADRHFATSLDGNTGLAISPKDSLTHTMLTGPTGSGKSTVMQNLIMSDIAAGRSVLVIDPKADLVENILERIPDERQNDVVLIDPSDPAPVGFNPLAFTDYGDPTLVADAILAVFQQVFAANFGIRSLDVLSAALLTLAQIKGASLLWLPPLLTNANFRKKITAGVKGDVALSEFWTTFEAMKPSEQQIMVAPAITKVRQFLTRPGLRNILGQSYPKTSLTELFCKPRIYLVPLNKGVIGSESARLLGSLLVSLTWTLALSRAKLPEHKRYPVGVYIDELQDYIALPTDFADALAQARGLGVGITAAFQHRAQLPPDLRSAINANCLNKVVFGLAHSDARDIAAEAPELTAKDFMSLPRHQIYTNIQKDGRATGWVSGVTLNKTATTRNPVLLRAKIRERYGISGEDTAKAYQELMDSCQPEPTPVVPGAIGRRKTP